MRALELADVLRGAGLKVEEVDGWKTRGKPFTAIKGVVCHHTAGPKTGNAPSLNIVTHGRAGLPGPLSQLVLGRDGTFYVVASGRSNHAGPGKWQGVTSGNSNLIGIEAENAGTGDDPWPDEQMYAYVVGCAALAKHYGFDPVMVAGHKEWAQPKGRKIDPTFDMVEFRQAVDEIGDLTAGTPAKPKPPVPVHQTDPARAMLRKGSMGPDVKKLQQLLKITADGNFGPKTEAAVKVFQKSKGLVADGLVGPKTWAALGVK